MSVLLASVSDALRSREVEFMDKVLLENQMPICKAHNKPEAGNSNPQNMGTGGGRAGLEFVLCVFFYTVIPTA